MSWFYFQWVFNFVKIACNVASPLGSEENQKILPLLPGDDLKRSVTPGAKLQIAASCFSIYAYEALKSEQEQVESVEFIFTSPTFLHGQATDTMPKERREFFIPKLERERSLYGTEFEIQEVKP